MKPRRPPRGRSVLLDLRPLQGGDAGRGIGATVRGIAGSFPYADAILWRGLPQPDEASGRRAASIWRPSPRTRLSWVADAAASRATTLASTSTSTWKLPHLMSADVSYDVGGRYVLTVNDAIPWRFPDLYPAGPTGRLRMALTARMARAAARVVVPSSVSADDVVRYLGVRPGRVEIIPWACDPELSADKSSLQEATRDRLRGRLGLRDPYIVMAGGFAHHDPRKRYEDAAAALKVLPDEVTLVVTGRGGPASAPFQAAVESLGVGPRVRLTGHLGSGEMATLFRSAAAFVFPSLWEGFGLPLLEAFSLSVPAVVSDGGSLPEVAGDAALVYHVGDIPALAAQLSRIIESPETAQELSRRGRERCDSFSWASIAREYSKIYQECGADPPLEAAT
jgi:glycosyltransferase involved in cell wall biosynthesis